MNSLNPNTLSDITEKKEYQNASCLQWVGMEGVALPIRLSGSSLAQEQLNAKVDIYVSLDDPEQKGIHMSRLYLALKQQLSNQDLNTNRLKLLLECCVAGQDGISQNAKLQLRFPLCLKKPALLSEYSGYQSYPIQFSLEYRQGEFFHDLLLEIPYSSTCPYSASLSRQLLADRLQQRFEIEPFDANTILNWIKSEEGSVATPHSQRSMANLSLKLENFYPEKLPQLIFEIEKSIGTPVQTAVKREDEQEFARLNAENLMFCEDAAKRIKSALLTDSNITDFYIKVEHQESLHAHNAVAIDSKFYSRNNRD